MKRTCTANGSVLTKDCAGILPSCGCYCPRKAAVGEWVDRGRRLAGSEKRAARRCDTGRASLVLGVGTLLCARRSDERMALTSPERLFAEPVWPRAAVA